MPFRCAAVYHRKSWPFRSRQQLFFFSSSERCLFSASVSTSIKNHWQVARPTRASHLSPIPSLTPNHLPTAVRHSRQQSPRHSLHSLQHSVDVRHPAAQVSATQPPGLDQQRLGHWHGRCLVSWSRHHHPSAVRCDIHRALRCCQIDSSPSAQTIDAGNGHIRCDSLCRFVARHLCSMLYVCDADS